MNNYMPYTAPEIETLMNEPWEVSDQPYRLHAAFALSCLYDLCADEKEDEEDEDAPRDTIWGRRLPKRMIDRLAQDIADDFNDAAANYKPVKIWGKSYSVRRTNAYDRSRLAAIFDFPAEGADCVISKEGIANLAGTTPEILEPFEVSRRNVNANRTYLRQIIMLAEDDENNGWDKLTDMEVAVYCWASFYNRHQADNFVLFKEKYASYLYAPENEIRGCFNEKARLRESPVGMYTFSADRVKAWNEAHGQKSCAAKIPEKEAEDYWYDVALKKTFKPIDLK